MHDSHAFVLFSNYENLPCVILEAMSCGRPVIATDVGGVREHLTPKRGYLISKRDEQELENSMLRCADEYQKFNPEELRKYAVDHFSVNAIASQFDALYREALNH
jgi:glycosyltransferase involved in cell wall biosynthesis